MVIDKSIFGLNVMPDKILRLIPLASNICGPFESDYYLDLPLASSDYFELDLPEELFITKFAPYSVDFNALVRYAGEESFPIKIEYEVVTAIPPSCQSCLFHDNLVDY